MIPMQGSCKTNNKKLCFKVFLWGHLCSGDWKHKSLPSPPSNHQMYSCQASLKSPKLVIPYYDFFSCIRITPWPSKNPTQAHSERYQAMDSLIKLFLGKEQTNTGVCVWNTSLVPLYLQSSPELGPKTPIPGWAPSFWCFLLSSSPSVRIKGPAPSDLPRLLRHKHNKNLFFSGCDGKVYSMR